jgi:methionine aminopeptidase
MSKKENKKVEDAAETYEVNPKNEETSEDLHPILVKLLEKGLNQIKNGEVRLHEEVMADMKKKYNFSF